MNTEEHANRWTYIGTLAIQEGLTGSHMYFVLYVCIVFYNPY